MSSEKYSYEVDTQFPNHKVNGSSLHNEVDSSDIVTVLEGINVNPPESPGMCDIWFVDALSTEDETTLDGIVAAHQGDPPITLEFKASNKLIENIKDVTEDETWETVGGTVTTLAAFIPDVTKAWGRLIGQCMASGTGAQVRIIRDSDGVVCGGPYEVADTSSAWADLQEWVNQNQPPNTDCYLLQARLNGATSLQMRYFTISLFEKHP
jgi:hypothetical protein